jgi:hypothetical protein
VTFGCRTSQRFMQCQAWQCSPLLSSRERSIKSKFNITIYKHHDVILARISVTFGCRTSRRFGCPASQLHAAIFFMEIGSELTELWSKQFIHVSLGLRCLWIFILLIVHSWID